VQPFCFALHRVRDTWGKSLTLSYGRGRNR